MATTIQLDNDVKMQLDSFKIHRETYNDLLLRILDSYKLDEVDRESLIATVEVLSDPELMKGIGEALREKGGTSIEDLRAELGV